MNLCEGKPSPSFVPSGRRWHGDDHCLYAVSLPHGLLNFDNPLLHGEPLFGGQRQIRPQMNIFSFNWLTGHESNLGKFFDGSVPDLPPAKVYVDFEEAGKRQKAA